MVVGLSEAINRLPAGFRRPAAHAFEQLLDDARDTWFERPFEVWYPNSDRTARRKAVLLIGHAPPFTFDLFLIRDRARHPAIVVGNICTHPEPRCVC